MRRRMARGPKGFNLVELMIVVAIIGLIVVLSVPALLQLGAERQSVTVARSVTLHMRWLRDVAVSTNRAFVVRIREGNPSDPLARGRIDVYPSTSSRCAAARNTADPELSVDMSELSPDNVQIVRASPRDNNGVVELCIRPDGAVVGLSGEPSIANGTSQSDGCAESQEEWRALCGQNGVACMKIAAVNVRSTADKRCWDVDGSGEQTHVGEDHIVSLTFSGGARMVR